MRFILCCVFIPSLSGNCCKVAVPWKKHDGIPYTCCGRRFHETLPPRSHFSGFAHSPAQSGIGRRKSVAVFHPHSGCDGIPRTERSVVWDPDTLCSDGDCDRRTRLRAFRSEHTRRPASRTGSKRGTHFSLLCASVSLWFH